MNMRNTLSVAAIVTLLLVMTALGAYWWWHNREAVPSQAGLMQVDCWFKAGEDWPSSECYRMYVPENHQQADSRLIYFPVVAFRNPHANPNKAPILHLGAGGPGAPMYLNSEYTVQYTWEDMRTVWLDQGRDLYLIDPRGSGLAHPLLTCDTFVYEIIGLLQQNLSNEQMLRANDKIYADCITRFKKEGIDLGAYNSLSVAEDINLLREALGIEQWVLYGVSHGAIYAQVIVNEFPKSVAAMILDSPAFLNLKPHHNYLAVTMAPYEALYHYCEKATQCDAPLDNFKERFWTLYEQFTANPVEIKVPHPDKLGKSITVLLNGNLFVETIIYGLYDKEIFDHLPTLITELEKGHTAVIAGDVSWYLAYLLDNTYGDVSGMSHHCYETIPFTDKELIKQLAQQLPEGYIRDVGVLAAHWPDQCKLMGIKPGDERSNKATQTDIPTLFLVGKFDTITPLRDVLEQQPNFSNSQVLSYPLSHGILGVDECADDATAAFLENPQADLSQVECVTAE